MLSLVQIGAPLVMVVAVPVLLARWLAGSEGPTIADAFSIEVDPPWPRGVQEEEPVRWRPEAIQKRPSVDHHVVDCPDRRAGGRVIGLGTEAGR
jgi:hypothetical protein